MTKSREKGDSPIIDHARKEAARTGRSFDEILDEMMQAAKRAKDTARRMEIKRAQKFLKVRDQRKRRGKR